eukprot:5631412-Amphidinium_carterae.1
MIRACEHLWVVLETLKRQQIGNHRKPNAHKILHKLPPVERARITVLPTSIAAIRSMAAIFAWQLGKADGCKECATDTH